MTGRDAFDIMEAEGFLEINPLGWAKIVRSPTKQELNQFVRLIKTLGAYSVGVEAPIEVSCGYEPDSILFRKRIW